ncbi:MAG: cytochrome-c oxidase [Pirellula sp.]|nr:cytochrome-c oxidase [Pirellula sp.]
MFESKAGVLFIGGVGFFVLAFVANAAVPMLMYRDIPELTAQQVVNSNLVYQFEDLNRRFPDSFKKHVGDLKGESWDAAKIREKCADLLKEGRDIYVAEGCWHCHSQFVRPVSNESLRYGPVAKSEEYQNELQRPVLFGTRRVGPDLSREGGRRSSDWHAAHFFDPPLLSPKSPMPRYPWFFEGEAGKPNRRGLAITLYVQWLGSWLESYPYYEDYAPVDILDPAPKAP